MEAAGRQAYFAAAGDTVEKIAFHYDLDSELVAAMNNTQPQNRLYVGQPIWLPLEPVQSYSVEPGDTLWSLARRYSVSVSELAAANDMAAGEILTVGRVLHLPPQAAPAPYRMMLAREAPASRGASFIWPVAGTVSSPYGWRSRGWHCGLDIAAPYGDSVCAVQTGIVKQAGWRSTAYGNTVEIDHGNGLSTLYAHNSRVLVAKGQFVRQGQVIALVGDSGDATGAHVHLEVRLNGACQNPSEYLR